jgi:hypothetical protein
LSLKDSVHLNLRCDGSAHGGCQAECLLFWKKAWLKPVTANSGLPHFVFEPAASKTSRFGSPCTEEAIARAAVHSDAGSELRFSCQATELLSYTKPLPWWDPRQYAEDYMSGNVSLGRMLEIFAFHTYALLTRCNNQRWGKLGRWLYDKFQSLRGGVRWPLYRGKIPLDAPTPRRDLGLEPGDWVRVKTYEKILETLNMANCNRNLSFDRELAPYCGRVFRIRSRVTRFIDEPTGKLKFMKTPALILEGVFCQAFYGRTRLSCPRSIYCWWREIWLERVSPPADGM